MSLKCKILSHRVNESPFQMLHSFRLGCNGTKWSTHTHCWTVIAPAQQQDAWTCLNVDVQITLDDYSKVFTIGLSKNTNLTCLSHTGTKFSPWLNDVQCATKQTDDTTSQFCGWTANVDRLQHQIWLTRVATNHSKMWLFPMQWLQRLKSRRQLQFVPIKEEK